MIRIISVQIRILEPALPGRGQRSPIALIAYVLSIPKKV